MRLEDLPLLFGALVALIGLGLLADAWLSDPQRRLRRDRRRRTRAERDRWGEALIGLGLVAFGAALAGRDSWRFNNVAVIAGIILLVTGTILNGAFLREVLLHRGPARRQHDREPRGPEVLQRHPESVDPAEPPARIR